MRQIAFLVVLGLCGVPTNRAMGDLPPARYLETPSSGEERLFPASASEVKLEGERFELVADDECILRIFCSGSLQPGFAVAVNRKADGSFVITGVRVKFGSPSQEHLLRSSTALETALGVRLAQVMSTELSRITPGSKDKKIYLDTDTYLFWGKSENRSSSGKTCGSLIANSRLQRFEGLAGQLCGLAFAGERDRVEILGAIDRYISEIELANKLLK